MHNNPAQLTVHGLSFRLAAPRPLGLMAIAFVGLFISRHSDASRCLELSRSRPGPGHEVLHRPLGSAIRVHNREIMNASEREQVQAILLDSQRPIEKKIGDVLAIYLAARLSMVDPRERAVAMQQILTLPLDTNARGVTEVHSNLINVPEKLKGNPVLLTSIVHELEHRIQSAQVRQPSRPAEASAYRYPRLAWYFLALRYGVQTKFVTERDAIGAEWEILSVLPPAIRALAAAAVEATPMQDKRMKDLYLRILSSAHLSRDEYISSEHRAGRYSRRSIGLESSVNMARTAYSGAKLASLLYVISLLFQGDEESEFGP